MLNCSRAEARERVLPELGRIVWADSATGAAKS
jgi:hypothetical protein